MFKKMFVSAVMIGISSTALADNSMMLSNNVKDHNPAKSCLYKSELYGEGTVIGDMKCVKKSGADALDENAPLVWETSFYKQ